MPTLPARAELRRWSRSAGAVCLAAGLGCGWSDPPKNPDIKPAPITSPGWTITRRYSAHHVLVVDVEAEDRSRAEAIAREIVEPVKESYGEALVYVRPPGADSPTRRVQWTAKTGYRVLDY